MSSYGGLARGYRDGAAMVGSRTSLTFTVSARWGDAARYPEPRLIDARSSVRETCFGGERNVVAVGLKPEAYRAENIYRRVEGMGTSLRHPARLWPRPWSWHSRQSGSGKGVGIVTRLILRYSAWRTRS